MKRNRYTTTGLAFAIASLVLAGCGSADAQNGKVDKQKVEKPKVEKVEKPKVEKRGLAAPQQENASDFRSTSQRL